MPAFRKISPAGKNRLEGSTLGCYVQRHHLFFFLWFNFKKRKGGKKVPKVVRPASAQASFEPGPGSEAKLRSDLTCISTSSTSTAHAPAPSATYHLPSPGSEAKGSATQQISTFTFPSVRTYLPSFLPSLSRHLTSPFQVLSRLRLRLRGLASR